MAFCQLSFFYNTVLTVSGYTEQNLIFDFLFPCFIFFQLCNLFDFGSCTFYFS